MYFTQLVILRMVRSRIIPPYFGQPSAGLFFVSDFFTASRQLPDNLSTLRFGPGLTRLWRYSNNALSNENFKIFLFGNRAVLQP